MRPETAGLMASAVFRPSLAGGRSGGRANGGLAATASSQPAADNAVTSTGGRLSAKGRCTISRSRWGQRGRAAPDCEVAQPSANATAVAGLCLVVSAIPQRSGFGRLKTIAKGGRVAITTVRLAVRSARPAERKSDRLIRESSRVGGALAAALVSGRLRLP